MSACCSTWLNCEFFSCVFERRPFQIFGSDAEYSEIYFRKGNNNFLSIYFSFIESCYSTLNNLWAHYYSYILKKGMRFSKRSKLIFVILLIKNFACCELFDVIYVTRSKVRLRLTALLISSVKNVGGRHLILDLLHRLLCLESPWTQYV